MTSARRAAFARQLTSPAPPHHGGASPDVVDLLTGLPDRRGFEASLEAVLGDQGGGQPAVVLCQLDRLEVINEVLGGESGDEVIRLAADRLRGEAPDEVIARAGGGRFLLLLTDVEDAGQAARRARRMRDALTAPFPLHSGDDVATTVSMGVVLPSGGEAPAAVLARAREATEHARSAGRNRVQVHDEGTIARSHSLSAEQDLRRAIRGGELELHYQPVLDLRSGAVVGCEALVRWRRPSVGLLLPERFIGLAEQTGLIRSLDDWVMREAIEQASRWGHAGGALADMVVSVNLSPSQSLDEGLARRTGRMLHDAGVEGSRLCVELTERSIPTDVGTAHAELRALRDLGVQVAIDDFGTGWSSLAQLRELPIDVVKLDAAFVANAPHQLADTMIVSSVNALAGALGMRTVAEGVESREALDVLRRIGCRVGQGFLFSPALPADALAEYIGS